MPLGVLLRMRLQLPLHHTSWRCWNVREHASFVAWAKLFHYGNPTDAFLLQTHVPDPPTYGRARAVIAHTRARHTRERAAVEKMILRQLDE
jgi:hypothetical protein